MRFFTVSLLLFLLTHLQVAQAQTRTGTAAVKSEAVAGVPTEDLVDNAMEMEQEGEGFASVSVEVMTDPRNSLPFTGARTQVQGEDGQAEPSGKDVLVKVF